MHTDRPGFDKLVGGWGGVKAGCFSFFQTAVYSLYYTHPVLVIHETCCSNLSATNKNFFIVIRDLVYFTTCFGQVGHL